MVSKLPIIFKRTRTSAGDNKPCRSAWRICSHHVARRRLLFGQVPRNLHRLDGQRLVMVCVLQRILLLLLLPLTSLHTMRVE